MPLDFPDTPAVGDTHEGPNRALWRWDGKKWKFGGGGPDTGAGGWEIGDARTTSYRINDPDWLLANGAVVDPALYPELAAKVDGALQWSIHDPLADGNMRGIAWSPELELFAAAGSTSRPAGQVQSAVIQTSPDGITWTDRARVASGTDDYFPLWAIAWSPQLGIFVAVGAVGVVAGAPYPVAFTSSTDGMTWTRRNVDTVNMGHLYGVAWSPLHNRFVAAGFHSGNPFFYYSPNGIAWTRVVPAETGMSVRGVCWSPALELFVAVGNINSGQARFFTSPDGSAWTVRTPVSNPSGQVTMWSISWSEELGRFVTCGVGSTGGHIFRSDNAVLWHHQQETGPTGQLYGVAWSPTFHQFWAVGYLSSINAMMWSSPDGITPWARMAEFTVSSWVISLCWSPKLNKFVGCGSDTGANFAQIRYYSTEPALRLPHWNSVMPYTYIRAK